MKKSEFFVCLVLIIASILSISYVFNKDYAEVYTKISDNEICFFSQEDQAITVEVLIIEENKEYKLKEKIEIGAENEEVLNITDITNSTFFTKDAKIAHINIVKQEPSIEYKCWIGIAIVGICVCIFAIAEGIKKEWKTRNIKIVNKM